MLIGSHSGEGNGKSGFAVNLDAVSGLIAPHPSILISNVLEWIAASPFPVLKFNRTI